MTGFETVIVLLPDLLAAFCVLGIVCGAIFGLFVEGVSGLIQLFEQWLDGF